MFLAWGPGCRELFCFRYTTTSPGRKRAFMMHSASFYLHTQNSIRISGWEGGPGKEVPARMLHLATRERRQEILGIWLENAVISRHHECFVISITTRDIAAGRRAVRTLRCCVPGLRPGSVQFE